MADQHSSVGSHLAELYDSIEQHQREIEDAKAVVKEKEDALKRVKDQFADYLKQQGIYQLIAPVQSDLFDNGTSLTPAKPRAEGKDRKPRTSSADKQAEIERNKAIYTSTYPNGIDEKTGLPKRFKGRGKANEEIDAQMKDDERDYAARNGGDSNVNLEFPLPEELKTEAPSTLAMNAAKEGNLLEHKPAAKSKAKK